jgi:hypothetical protein
MDGTKKAEIPILKEATDVGTGLDPEMPAAASLASATGGVMAK